MRKVFSLQKHVMRIVANSKYDAHTDPLFKDLEMLEAKDIFYVLYFYLWYKFLNNEFPHFFEFYFYI